MLLTVYLIVYLVRPIQLQFQFLVCVEVLLKWDLQKITKHNLKSQILKENENNPFLSMIDNTLVLK